MGRPVPRQVRRAGRAAAAVAASARGGAPAPCGRRPKRRTPRVPASGFVAGPDALLDCRAVRRPFATVSVDVDPVDLHLVGYGVSGLPPDALVYERALPRLLERFAAHGVRATLFVVGRDAARAAPVLRAAVAAGHEIASHSFSHPLALASLPPAALADELSNSKRALEDASGQAVVGFRSPNFDMNDATLSALAAAGYRYDASGYPTPVLTLARLVLAAKGGNPAGVLRLRLWPFTLRRDPHRMTAARGGLFQFPVTVTRGARWPVYHTLRYGQSDAGFERTLDALAARGETLSYPLHAVDALGLAEDRVDGRLARHPGMGVPLARKLDLLDRTLAAIAARFDPAPFAARLARDEAAVFSLGGSR